MIVNFPVIGWKRKFHIGRHLSYESLMITSQTSESYMVSILWLRLYIYAGYMYFYGEQRVLNMRNQFTNPNTRLYDKPKNTEAKGVRLECVHSCKGPRFGFSSS